MSSEVLLEILPVGELPFGEHLVSLPVGAALPPSTVSPSIAVESPAITVAAAEVGSHKILEGVPHLMSNGVPTPCTCRPGIEMPDASLAPCAIGLLPVGPGSIGTPVGLERDVELNLIIVGR